MRYFILLIALAACSGPMAPQTEAVWTWESRHINYIEKGAGSNHIVLLHGFAGSTYSWRNQIETLASRGYHVWAIDLLGFGLSDKPLDIDYSLDLYEAQVLDFMAEHNIPKAHLAGHSMGGAIALSLAVHTPDKFTSLTLVDPAGYPLELPRALKVGKKLGKLGAAFINRDTIQKILTQLYYDNTKITEEQIDTYYLPFQMEGGKRCCMLVLKAFENEILEELSTHYHTIHIPTLLIWGEEDLWIPATQLSLYAESIPKAKQITLSACGHAPQEEKPEEFNPPFFEFLKKHK